MSQRESRSSAWDRFSIQATVDFDPEQFLAVLNGEPVVDRWPETPGFAILSNLRRKDESAKLRPYLDEWLASGAEKDGLQEPKRRDLKDAPNARQALLRFKRQHSTVLEFSSDGASLRYRGRDPESVGKLMRSVSVGEQDQADRFFGLLFLAGWHRKLAKCKWCGRYFWLKHWNRIYKRGTCCPDPRCKRARSHASAVVSTSQTREMAEAELLNLAAKRFSKYIGKDPNWHQDQKLRARIIGLLNSRIRNSDGLRQAYPRGITEKWLSWAKNRDGIAKVAIGDTNAKSKRT